MQTNYPGTDPLTNKVLQESSPLKNRQVGISTGISPVQMTNSLPQAPGFAPPGLAIAAQKNPQIDNASGLFSPPGLNIAAQKASTFPALEYNVFGKSLMKNGQIISEHESPGHAVIAKYEMDAPRKTSKPRKAPSVFTSELADRRNLKNIAALNEAEMRLFGK